MKRIALKVISLILAVAMLSTLAACRSAAAAGEETPDAIETILTAGTTQAFADDPVPEADINTILQAGLAAESAINQQPWFFVAVTDKNLMAELSGSGSRSGDGARPAAPQGGTASGAPQGGAMPSPPQGGSMPDPPQGGAPAAQSGSGAKASLGDSPLAIIVYMNENTSSPNPSFDCGLAVQNMYIAAASLGYGAKIISSPTRSLNGADHDEICQKLGVDPSLTAVAVLLIGKPATDVDGVSGATTRADLGEKAIIIG